MKAILVAVVLMLLTACSRQAPQERAAEAGRKAEAQPKGTVRSEVDSVVETMTGITAVRTGEVVKKKLNKVQEQQKRQMKEVEDM